MSKACLLAIVLAALAIPFLGSAQSLSDLTIYGAVREQVFPSGYSVVDRKTGSSRVVKTFGPGSTANVAAHWDSGGVRHYISDWSLEKMRSSGRRPNWMIAKPGAKPPPPPATVARTSSAAPARSSSRSGTRYETATAYYRNTGSTRRTVADSESPDSRFVSVLIGNSQYSKANPSHAALDLQNPTNDIDLINQSLIGFGAETIIMKDALREETMRTISDTISSLGDQDAFFLYFAGHGVQLEGENYLLPVGAEFESEEQLRESSIGLSSILDQIAQKDLRLNCIVLDCCRNNPFSVEEGEEVTDTGRGASAAIKDGEQKNTTPPKIRTRGGLAEVAAPEDTLVAFATGPGQVALDGAEEAGDNSPYAAALAQAFRKNMEIRQIFETTGKTVRRWTRNAQNPWKSNDPFSSFYPHLTQRRVSNPDNLGVRAGQTIRERGMSGVPESIAFLASSLEGQPDDSLSAVPLLYLLSYQNLPVRINQWEPFEVTDWDLDKFDELRVTKDGKALGLIHEGRTLLTLDRNSGEWQEGGTLTGSTFPSDKRSVEVKSDPSANLGGAGISNSLWALKLTPWVHSMEIDGTDPYESSFVREDGEILVTNYLPEERRIFIAHKKPRGFSPDAGHLIRVAEYALAPPVIADVGLINFEKNTYREGVLARGNDKDSGKSWLLKISNGQVVFESDNTEQYRRDAQGSEKHFDDWIVDQKYGRIVLAYRNGFDILSFSGENIAKVKIPWADDGAARIVNYSAPFQRIMIAVYNDQGLEGESDINLYDTATGRQLGSIGEHGGYYHFGGTSDDGEWLYYYDQTRRLRMVDAATGGRMFQLPSTRTPVSLPVARDPEDLNDLLSYESFGTAPTLRTPVPPFIGVETGFYEIPAWLPDLASTLVGFRLDLNGHPEWIENSPTALKKIAREMRESPGNFTYTKWTQWFLEHRLGSMLEEK